MSAAVSSALLVLLAPWPDCVSMRINTGLAWTRFRLQGGRVLEGMGRYHAIIVVRGGDECRRIGHAVTNIVYRRVSIKLLELFRVVARAIVRNPVPSDRELLKSKHVHDRDLGHGGAKQIWPLVDHRTHQEAAVRASRDG